MRIRLKNIVAGPLGTFSPGIHELPDGFARDLIIGGYAEAIEEPKQVIEPSPPEPEVPAEIEVAMVEPEEEAIIPRPRGRSPAKKK